MPSTKTCTKCGETKTLSEFYRTSPKRGGGPRSECKICTLAPGRTPEGRAKAIARTQQWIKANPDKYAARVIKHRRRQRGQVNTPTRPQPIACECCGEIPTKMFEDHDHTTGLFRGWLCHHCNSGLGLFKDSPERLQQAITYLRTYGYIGDVLNGIHERT